MKLDIELPLRIKVDKKNVPTLLKGLKLLKENADPFETDKDDLVIIYRLIEQLEETQSYLMRRKREIEEVKENRSSMHMATNWKTANQD